jgi:hypothetical protein
MFDLYEQEDPSCHHRVCKDNFQKVLSHEERRDTNQVKIKTDVVLDGGLQGKDAVVTDKFMAKLDDANGKVYFLFQNALDLSRLDQ